VRRASRLRERIVDDGSTRGKGMSVAQSHGSHAGHGEPADPTLQWVPTALVTLHHTPHRMVVRPTPRRHRTHPRVEPRKPNAGGSGISDRAGCQLGEGEGAEVSLRWRSLAIWCTPPRPIRPVWDKNCEREASATSGRVTRNTTTRPARWTCRRVNAKPRTCPTASTYRTAAARKLTASADRIVRRARTQPRAQRSGSFCPRALRLQSFEEHHKRVGGDTDSDDEPGDAGQVEGEADVAAQEHQHRVDHQTGQAQ